MTPNFNPPEADWTDDFPWTRYRGPQPYPVPADWVLDLVEADGISWYRFPEIGEGLEKDSDVFDVFEDDEQPSQNYEDARGEMAGLSKEIVEFSSRDRTETVEHELIIDGDTVFRRVDPDTDDLFATVAEALARYSNDQDLDDLQPSTGWLPEDIRREQEIERRKENNQNLEAFE